MIINISKKDEYHTQRNNQIDPTVTCNVTAMINALKTAGIEFWHPQNMQPEDYLSELLSTPEAWEKMRKEHAIFDGVPPREVHWMLSWAVNEKLVQRPVTTFSTTVDLRTILYRIAKYKSPAVVSGRFTKSGHVVTVVGFDTGQNVDLWKSKDDVNLEFIDSIIIDDPWGDWRSDYKVKNGNDIPIPYKDFIALTREYGSATKKWAHLFYQEEKLPDHLSLSGNE